MLAAAGATIVEGRGDVAGKVGIAAMGAVRGGGILGIRGTQQWVAIMHLSRHA